MMSPKKVIPFYLFIDLLLLIVCILGVINIYYRAGLPFQINYQDDKLFISNVEEAGRTIEGWEILEINHLQVSNVLEAEFALDGVKAGEEINILARSGEKLDHINIIAHRFYGVQYLISASFVALSFFLIAILVLLKQPNEKGARVFHWVCILTSIILTTTWSFYETEPKAIGILIRTAFSAAYVFAPAVFLHFTIIYPRELKFNLKYLLPVIYSAAFVLAVGTSWSFGSAVIDKTIDLMQLYLSYFHVSQIFLVLNLIFGLIIFLFSYNTVKETYEKQKLRWILLGIFAGLAPYIIFWVLPLMIWGDYFVPEEIIILFTIFIPITFAISIIRYRIFNINLIIERGIIYLIVAMVLLIVISGLIIIISTLLEIKDNLILSVLIAIIAALLFQPTYRQIQKFVDKRIFRIRYNFRNALRQFLNEINEKIDEGSLAETVVVKTNELIPVQKIGYFNLNSKTNRLYLLSHKNFDILDGRSVMFSPDKLKTELQKPVVLSDRFERGTDVEIADVRVFKRWGMNIVFPVKSVGGNLFGFLVLGEKRSRTKFSLEDIDLLSIITNRMAGILERIKLQNDLIREHLEAEKLEEINRLKSFFISSVTHDLKTPLTSIKIFSELLYSNADLPLEKRNEFLKIIEGESDRLARLINSVLDYTKIEQGIKEYSFEPADINILIRDVLKSMRYQIEMEGFKVFENLCCEKIIVDCDKDAFTEALINLIDNAIKYSSERKSIFISTYEADNYLCLSVKDEGIGIKKSELDKILAPYYRTDEYEVHKKTGVGLGLSIIKHIMNAHKGKIEIESEWGSGSNFRLYFPLNNNYERVDKLRVE